MIKYNIVIPIALTFFGLYFLQKGGPIESEIEESCSLSVDGVTQILQEIELKYKMDIEYDVGNDVIPEQWRDSPFNGVVEPLHKDYLCRYVESLSLELKKYPNAVLQRDLLTIYLLDSLTFVGVKYGGTSIGNSLYLTGGSKLEGYSNTFYAALLHHEMSSIFYTTYNFPESDWALINPDDFRYAESDSQILQAIENGDEASNNEKVLSEGFLSEYARSTPENDFNSYAEMIFTEPKKLKKLAGKYPKIGQKVEIVTRFYLGISKDFDFNY